MGTVRGVAGQVWKELVSRYLVALEDGFCGAVFTGRVSTSSFVTRLFHRVSRDAPHCRSPSLSSRHVVGSSRGVVRRPKFLHSSLTELAKLPLCDRFRTTPTYKAGSRHSCVV